MSIEEIKSAEISDSSVSERKSITILEGILDPSKVVTYLNKNDKTPNYDGYLEIRGDDKRSVGKIETQVKTHRGNYSTPSYSIELKLLAYARDIVQLPFIVIAVDQNKKKAYWKEIAPETAREFINEALEKNEEQQSFAIQFDTANEISQNPPYDIWKGIIENHRKLIRDSTELTKQLIISETELKKIKSKSDLDERDENSNYIQTHIFLDTLNNLFSNEFRVIKKLFVDDFWKFGIITFGQIIENKIAYSLFSIGWNDNSKQIKIYKGSDNFQNFISDYLSVKAFYDENPLLTRPVNYAYEIIWEYLKLMLERNLIWSNNQYLQNEYLFHIKDRQFRNSEEEAKTIDLISLKEKIENYFRLIPYEERLMKQFPEMNNNLYRALDYIQNFRIEGKAIIDRLSPSKGALQSIPPSVAQNGKFPSDIETILFNYWNNLSDSYEDLLTEMFPHVRADLSDSEKFNTVILIPIIQKFSFNN